MRDQTSLPKAALRQGPARTIAVIMIGFAATALPACSSTPQRVPVYMHPPEAPQLLAPLSPSR